MPISWRIGEQAKSRFDRWLRVYPRATPVAVFFGAILLVVSSAWAVQRAGLTSRDAGTRNQASEIVASIEQQGATSSAYLASTSAIFTSLETVSPDLFHEFAERLRAIYDFNGVIGMGWSEAVPASQIPALRERLAEQGHPGLLRTPVTLTAGGQAHIITLIEPQTTENLKLIGFDMDSDPRRAAAMVRAERTNSVAATDPVHLLQDRGGERSGFLVFVPVNSRSNPRRLQGFVYSPVHTVDFISGAIGRRLLDSGKIEILDRTADGLERIYVSQPHVSGFDDPVEKQIHVFDQVWTLRYAPPSHGVLYPFTLLVLIGGISFALLLLAYVLLVQRRNEDLFAMIDAQVDREAERAAFVRELNHRVKNTLANVTSMVSLTRRNATDLNSFANALLDRVRALAASHTLLDGGEWGPTDLRTLVESQLGSFDKGGGRIVIDGPSLLISPNDAMTVGLAIHELATNATRYGALSSEEGQVLLRWTVEDDKWIKIDWEERGGPEPVAPARRGFGLSLIERALALDPSRPVRIEFLPSGLQCSFWLPVRLPKTFRLRS